MFKNIIYWRMQLKSIFLENSKHIQLSNHTRTGMQYAAISSFPTSSQKLLSSKKTNPCYASAFNKTLEDNMFFNSRLFSTHDSNKSNIDKNHTGQVDEEEPIIAMYDEKGNKLSNWARMKMMAKAYGYVIIPVHWIIAPVWFGSFYVAVTHGIDIVPLLNNFGVSEVYLSKLQNSGASNILQAYAMYKVATPARYTLTLAATEMTIRTLRKRGFMKPLPPKEKTYRESMQETYAGMKEKMEDVKDKMDDVKDKMNEVRDKLKDGEEKGKPN
ncbi:uncharacterized protein [Antedon mediterranea]|uniref:uncharacterized protein isoform X2 n=1 Tax=Antedon mediterranea TaxID=105859 RepID=UPI003AF765F7